MSTLKSLYDKYKKGAWPDKGDVHSYLDVYEEILDPYRHTAQNILEIGLMSGESLRMWTEYFDGTVYGMDCSDMPIYGMANLKPIMAEGKHNIFIGDASNPFDVKKYFDGIKLDVVIEDANHDIQQQVDIYNTLKPYLKKGSIYIIEDVQEIDQTIQIFKDLDSEKEISILDRRNIKWRYDDVLVILKDK